MNLTEALKIAGLSEERKPAVEWSDALKALYKEYPSVDKNVLQAAFHAGYTLATRK